MPAQITIKLANSVFSYDIKLEYSTLRKAILLFRSVNHKYRQTIIQMLLEKERMTVTDIFIQLRLEQSVASQHLALLKRSGIVYSVREGKNIYYALQKNRLQEIYNMINEAADL